MTLTCRRSVVVSDSPRPYNEDVGGVVEGAAWVLDGATGVTDASYTDAASDARWYVREFDAALREGILDRSGTLSEVVADAIRAVSARFGAFDPPSDLDAAAEPSATAAIVRWSGGTLEYFVLCDSTLLVSRADGVARVHDERLAPIQRDHLRAYRRLREDGLSHDAARERLVPALRETRRLKNTPAGYWVLSFDPAAATHALTGEFALDEAASAYLFTDGFGRLVERYEQSPDWASALEEIESDGLAATVDRIREVEAGDSDAETHPRLKLADDVTALRLDLRPVAGDAGPA